MSVSEIPLFLNNTMRCKAWLEEIHGSLPDYFWWGEICKNVRSFGICNILEWIALTFQIYGFKKMYYWWIANPPYLLSGIPIRKSRTAGRYVFWTTTQPKIEIHSLIYWQCAFTCSNTDSFRYRLF